MSMNRIVLKSSLHMRLHPFFSHKVLTLGKVYFFHRFVNPLDFGSKTNLSNLNVLNFLNVLEKFKILNFLNVLEKFPAISEILGSIQLKGCLKLIFYATASKFF